MRHRLLLLAALLAFAVAPPSLALAQETQPGDACAAGDIHRFRHVGGPENPGAGYMLVCDGSNWKLVTEWDTTTGSSLFQVDYDSAACDALKEGRLRYSSSGDLWEYCHNNAWTALGSGGSPAGSDRQIQFNSGAALGADSLFVFTSAGNLGIGTAAPVSKLHVHTGNAPGGIAVTSDGNNAPEIAVGRGDSWWSFTHDESNNDGYIGHWNDATSTWTQSITLFSDGNVAMLSGGYLNFGDSTSGSTGYGIRDNAGTLECKNSGGAWEACAGIKDVSGLSAPSYGMTCTRRTSSASSATRTVSCNAGEIMTGGGCHSSSTSATIEDSYPSADDTWTCEFSASATTTAYAICCSY